MASTNFEGNNSPLYTFEAASNRLGKDPNTVKQKIKRLRKKNLPLVIENFLFLLVAKNAYMAVDKDWKGTLYTE